MAERPADPRDFTAFQNETLRRLRELERHVLRLPDGSNPLQTFESGEPLGDTRFLDFGPGISAALIGDDYVEVSAFSATEFDAVVDSDLTASDPDNRFFIGIGEALTFLGPAGLNLPRAAVLVRGKDPIAFYSETANWTNPGLVF